MRPNRRALSLGIALAAVAAAPALCQESVTRSFPFQPGQKIEVKAGAGDIEYRTGGTGQMTVTVSVEQGKIADYVDLRFLPGADGLRVEADSKGSSSGGLGWLLGGRRSHGGGLHFVLEGPSQVDPTLATAGGNIKLADVEGTVSLATSGGDLEFGIVTGSVIAATSGGDVSGARVSGKATLATSGGDIRLGQGGDRSDLKTSGGNIEVESADGPLDLATSGGDVKVGDCAGEVTARSSGGDIRLGRVDGAVDLSTSGGDVEVRRAGADADISTSGGEVTVGEAAGKVTARSSGGDLTVTLADGNAAGGAIATSGGLLTVRIPSGVGLELEADARGGRVRSSLSFSKSAAEAPDRLTATLGGGGNRLTLRNERGDIRIEPASGDAK